MNEVTLFLVEGSLSKIRKNILYSMAILMVLHSCPPLPADNRVLIPVSCSTQVALFHSL